NGERCGSGGAVDGTEAGESGGRDRDSPGPRAAGAETHFLDGRSATGADQQGRHRHEGGSETVMPRDARFWRNVALVAIAHLVVLLALARGSRDAVPTNLQTVVWMNSEASTAVEPRSKPVPSPTPAEI